MKLTNPRLSDRRDVRSLAEEFDDLMRMVGSLNDRIEALEGELQRRKGGRPKKAENGLTALDAG